MKSISPSAAAFVQELEEVCKRHRLMLSVSGYDALQVWPLEDGASPLHAAGIEDWTASATSAQLTIELMVHDIAGLSPVITGPAP